MVSDSRILKCIDKTSDVLIRIIVGHDDFPVSMILIEDGLNRVTQ